MARFAWSLAPVPASYSKARTRPQTYLFLYGAMAALLILAHAPLLQLPFYWDELGQFIPASLDLFHGGHWIPRSTLPNVHPPGVMAYLSGVWAVTGYSITSTRVAMLLLAAAGALSCFLLAIELARNAPGAPAFSAVGLLLISPLFFAQSMLAQLDMPAMCFTVLAFLLFLQNRFAVCAVVCVALVLTKETGIVAPGLFGLWLLLEKRRREAALFVLPFVALAGWLWVLKQGTGHWFGNRQFTDYNVFYPLHPARLGMAILRRGYYLLVGSGHFIGTIGLVVAYKRLLIFRDRSWQIVAAFVALHVLAVCALGGAVLERYLLPVLPLVYIAFAIALASLRIGQHRVALVSLLACLLAANFVNPIYPFPFENNLAFVNFVDVQTYAAEDASPYPGIVASAFPMTDALRRPEAGYVESARKVMQLEGFRRRDIEPLRNNRPDVLIVFDTVWDPLRLLSAGPVNALMSRFYDYDRQLTADEIAEMIPMRIAHREKRGGLTAVVLVR